MSYLIELDAVLKILKDAEERHQQYGDRLYADNPYQFDRASRYYFAAIRIHEIIDLITELPRL